MLVLVVIVFKEKSAQVEERCRKSHETSDEIEAKFFMDIPLWLRAKKFEKNLQNIA